ncbi:hypothetical protein AB833_11470 [Chromatiales bacterium (ex Bugula neritina AB1)]|nr:hypothetical protein AB833_11470 [Chromatiales bacterium (ex Bugula neritina AB1)]
MLSDLAAVCGGHLEGSDLEIARANTNSRTVQSGDLFVCLRGDRFDGHDYALDAINQGAVAVVAETAIETGATQLVVPDSQRAFGMLAMLWRQRLAVKLIAVTGSNGKTTVKQILTAICRASGTVHATRANDNNQIGVPQTLLGISAHHQYAVVEMGANQLGEIASLAEIAQPDVAVITNVSASHLQGFGTIATVAEEKAAIYDGLADDGTSVINLDDDFADYWRHKNSHRNILTFGSGADADVSTSRVGSGRILLQIKGESVECDYFLPGEHNVLNAAAAAAAAIAAGISVERIIAGLKEAEPVSGRLNFHNLDSGHIIIDDTYNANPASTRAAIDVLQSVHGRKILVLGDLLELGEDAKRQHELIGQYARTHGVDQILSYGSLSRFAAKEFGEPENSFDNREALLRSLPGAMTTQSVVLVKGSRSMRMEEVVAGLLEHDAASVRAAGGSRS